jgi:hypothetical protein
MGRVALSKTKIIVLTVAAVCGVTAGGLAYMADTRPHHTPQVAVTAPRRLTDIRYRGQDGTDALTLLRRRAAIQTKHYSFGDMVVSINGVAGNGPKYWIFYVNGKEASVGAGSYVTKSGDVLEWRLQ